MDLQNTRRKRAQHKIRSRTMSEAEATVALKEPEILLQPQNKTMLPGKRVMLRISATGIPTPEYQWLHNGTVLENTNSPLLMIPNLEEQSCGVYTCDVKNIAGVRSSYKTFVRIWDGVLPELELKIEELPALNKHHSNLLSISIANFPQELSGFFSIHWYHEGTLIKKTYDDFIEVPRENTSIGRYTAVVITCHGRIKSNEVLWQNGNAINIKFNPKTAQKLKDEANKLHEAALEKIRSQKEAIAVSPESTLQSKSDSLGSHEKKKVFLEKFLGAWKKHVGEKKKASKAKPKKNKKKVFLEKALSHFGEINKKKKSTKKRAA